MSTETPTTFEEGDLVYDREGRQYRYVTASPAGGHFVRAISFAGDDEWLEDPALVANIYSEEPYAAVSERMSKALEDAKANAAVPATDGLHGHVDLRGPDAQLIKCNHHGEGGPCGDFQRDGRCDHTDGSGA